MLIILGGAVHDTMVMQPRFIIISCKGSDLFSMPSFKLVYYIANNFSFRGVARNKSLPRQIMTIENPSIIKLFIIIKHTEYWMHGKCEAYLKIQNMSIYVSGACYQEI